MNVKDMIADVARARAGLVGLQCDPDITPDRLERCASVVNDLETGLVEILTERWIPQTRFEIEASIASGRRNMRWVEDHIADCVDKVIERGHADAIFRLSTARILHDLLALQLDWLMTAWTKTIGFCGCGCGRPRPEQGWTN